MTDAMPAARPSPSRFVSGAARWFYPIAGVLLLALTVVGFRMFYFEGRSHPGREIPPPIRTLIITHGVAMSLWIVLFAAQPFLIVLGRYRAHKTLGRAGAALAAILVGTGLLVGVRSAQVTPPEVVISGLSPKQFMAVPMLTIVEFGVLVALGVWQRRRPPVHRACMFLGTLAVVGAAVSRIDPLTNVLAGTALARFFGPFAGMVLIGAALVALRCLLTRSADRTLLIGMASLIAAWALTIAIAPTAAWDAFASVFVR